MKRLDGIYKLPRFSILTSEQVMNVSLGFARANVSMNSFIRRMSIQLDNRPKVHL